MALARSSPASVRSRARSRSISANTMARCSVARPMSLSSSMDSRRRMISTPLSQPSQQLLNLGQRLTPSGPAPPPSRSRPSGGRPSGDSAPAGSKRLRCPRPRRPARSRPAPGASSASCWRRRRWLPTRGRIRGVFRSYFAGPRFWHGGVRLRWAEFWLCWKASLSGRVGHQAGAGRS